MHVERNTQSRGRGQWAGSPVGESRLHFGKNDYWRSQEAGYVVML